MFILRRTKGETDGECWPISAASLFIGRSAQCDVTVNDPTVSRRHCEVYTQNGEAYLRDLGSSNGTWVNDVRIVGPKVLKGGDLLRVGPALFQVDGPKPPPLLDHDIVDWLTEGDSKTGMVSEEDTAIHKGTGTVTAPAPHPEPLHHPVTHSRPKRVFKTVAEEAQYIIALYQEQKALEAEQGK